MFTLTIVPPPYILETSSPEAGPLLEARRMDLPEGQHEIVRIDFHHGRARWWLERERYSPVSSYPRDDRFLELSMLLLAFTDLTGLDVPPFLLLRPENDSHQVYLERKFASRPGNPSAIVASSTYLLPAPRHLSLAAPGGLYVGVETADGSGALVRHPAPADGPNQNELSFRHLTPAQQHRVIRTNLGLPLTTSVVDRHVDRINVASATGIEDIDAGVAARPRPR